MSARAFELSHIGGPWLRRLAPRRAWLDALPWDEALPTDVLDAQLMWTRTAFNEYASAAAFAEIATLLLAAGAPIDLVAAAGDFVIDEVIHAEAAARLATALGGFVIDTPAAAAVDLGCAYELVVDDAGRTHLRVTSGAVSLESKHGAAAYVLAGHEVDVEPGKRIGTPLASDTTPAMRAAVARYDGGEAAALADLLQLAEPNDMLTLWNLVARTRGAEREAATAALERFAQLPAAVRRDAVLAGDADAIEAWRAGVEARWLAPW